MEFDFLMALYHYFNEVKSFWSSATTSILALWRKHYAMMLSLLKWSLQSLTRDNVHDHVKHAKHTKNIWDVINQLIYSCIEQLHTLNNYFYTTFPRGRF